MNYYPSEANSLTLLNSLLFFFSISLLFSFFDFPCFFFCAFFLSFPRILGGSAKRKTLAFFEVSLAFFPKSKGWRVRVVSSK